MKYQFKKNKGFTLIELLVVIAILGIISSIILFNYSGFNSGVSLDNLSQDIALNMRKAQFGAIGVKGINIGGTTVFPGYGVHFQIPSSPNPNLALGSAKSFVFFADTSGDKTYNQSTSTCNETNLLPGNECMDVITITTLDQISAICLNDDPSQCYGADKSPTLDIVFTRPDPDAHFYFCSSTTNCRRDISSVSIKVKSPKVDVIREIVVRTTGQISVDSISNTTPNCVPPQILSGNTCVNSAPIYD